MLPRMTQLIACLCIIVNQAECHYQHYNAEKVCQKFVDVSASYSLKTPSQAGFVGKSLGKAWKQRMPVSAAVQSTHTIEYIDVPSNSSHQTVSPAMIEVAAAALPLNLIFRSSSTNLNLMHQHEPGVGETRESSSEDEPHRLYHRVTKPIYQQIYEIVTPYRKITQQIEPVQEEIQTIINRDLRNGKNVAPESLMERAEYNPPIGTKTDKSSLMEQAEDNPPIGTKTAKSIYSASPADASNDLVGMISPAKPADAYYSASKKTQGFGNALRNSMPAQAQDYDSSDKNNNPEPSNSYMAIATPTTWMASNDKMQKASTPMHNTNVYSDAHHLTIPFAVFRRSVLQHPTIRKSKYRRPSSPINRARFEKFLHEYLKWQERSLMNETNKMVRKMPAQFNRYELQKDIDEQQSPNKMVTFEHSLTDGLEKRKTTIDSIEKMVKHSSNNSTTPTSRDVEPVSPTKLETSTQPSTNETIASLPVTTEAAEDDQDSESEEEEEKK